MSLMDKSPDGRQRKPRPIRMTTPDDARDTIMPDPIAAQINTLLREIPKLDCLDEAVRIQRGIAEDGDIRDPRVTEALTAKIAELQARDGEGPDA